MDAGELLPGEEITPLEQIEEEDCVHVRFERDGESVWTTVRRGLGRVVASRFRQSRYTNLRSTRFPYVFSGSVYQATSDRTLGATWKPDRAAARVPGGRHRGLQGVQSRGHERYRGPEIQQPYGRCGSGCGLGGTEVCCAVVTLCCVCSNCCVHMLCCLLFVIDKDTVYYHPRSAPTNYF